MEYPLIFDFQYVTMGELFRAYLQRKPYFIRRSADHTEGGLYYMNVVEGILIALETIASIALIVVVLLQSGKEAGLSGALSGSSDSYLSKNKNGMDHILATSTKWLALAWIVLTLVLSLI